MTNLQVFNFEGYDIRVFGDSDNLMFVAIDVAKALGISKSTLSHRLSRMPSKWKKGVVSDTTPGGIQEILVISEPGFYSLVFRSNKKEAIKFQDWVFEEVLPSIRKKGRYELPNETMKRNRVVTELIMLKQQNRRNLELVNICNDIIDYTNGTAGFPQVSVYEAEALLDAVRAATMGNTALYDVKTSLKNVISLN
jgi:prophage antirepressor-like protein